MEKIIACRHLDVSDDIKNFINSELDKIEGEYSKLTSVRVVLDVQRNWHYTEVILHGKKISIEAKSKSKDLQNSISLSIQKAKKQLKKYLDRIQDPYNYQDKKGIV